MLLEFSLSWLGLMCISIFVTNAKSLDSIETLISDSFATRIESPFNDRKIVRQNKQKCGKYWVIPLFCQMKLTIRLSATLPSFMKSQARIVNGFIAPKPIPWIVSIWSPDAPVSTFCTGTILDELTVLTAAHCVVENPAKKGTLIRIMVMAGSTKVQEGINILVERVIFAKEMWETYNINNVKPKTVKADMAILKLSRPMPFDETIMPLCLPTETFDYKMGLECFIAGWGTISCEYEYEKYKHFF